MKFISASHAGNYGVATAISYFTMKNYSVLVPFGDNCRYDIVIEMHNAYHRIQCKYTTRKNGNGYRIGFSSGNEPYKSPDFDMIWVKTPKNSYLIPSLWIFNNIKILESITVNSRFDSFIVE